MDSIKKVLEFLRSSPLWIRCIAALVAALLVLIFTSSCGQTVRVTVRDTPNGVSISTTQHKSDSSGTSIKINPTIHLNGK